MQNIHVLYSFEPIVKLADFLSKTGFPACYSKFSKRAGKFTRLRRDARGDQDPPYSKKKAALSGSFFKNYQDTP